MDDLGGGGRVGFERGGESDELVGVVFGGGGRGGGGFEGVDSAGKV